MLDFKSPLTVSEAIAEKVLHLISSGKLAWGQKLPSQRELARILKVGVSSLREGLQILQTTGFVEIKRGQGTYITDNPSKPLSEKITRSIFIDSNIKNLMEARNILEVGVAGLAARQAKKSDIENMSQSLENLKRAVEDNSPEASKYDIEFHSALAESVNNPILLKFSAALRSTLEEFIGEIEHTKRGVAYHWKVYEAIKERSPQKAWDTMRALLKMTERTYLKHMSGKEKSDE